MRVYEVGGVSDAELDSAEAHKRAEIRGVLQSKVIAEMIKSLSSGVPKERAMEKAFKARAYWWQIGEHFGMSQQTAYGPCLD